MKIGSIKKIVQKEIYKKKWNFTHQSEKWDDSIFINGKVKTFFLVIPLFSFLVVFIDWLIVLYHTLYPGLKSDILLVLTHPYKLILTLFFLVSSILLISSFLGKDYYTRLGKNLSMLILLISVAYIIFCLAKVMSVHLPLMQKISLFRNYIFELIPINAVVGFILFHFSLIAAYSKGRYKILLSQLFALNLILIDLLWAISHITNNPTLYVSSEANAEVNNYLLSFLFLGIGAFFIFPRKGIFSLLVMKSFGGIITRRLFPIILLIPFLFIWVLYINSKARGDVNPIIVGPILGFILSFFLYFLWESATKVNMLEAEFRGASNKTKDSNERFSLAVEAAGFGVWDYNPITQQVIWDNRMYEIYGIDSDQKIDIIEFWKKSFHPDDIHFSENTLQTAIKEGENYKCEYRIIHADGSVRYLKALGKILFDENGIPVRITGLTQDQTDIKDAENKILENEKKYKYLFNENPVPIWILDEQSLDFIDVNKASILHYGYSEADFQNMNYSEIWPKEDAKKFEEMLRKDSILKHSGICRHLKKNGEIIYVDVKSEIIDYWDRKARIVICNDVTRQKNTVDKMKQLNDELEERVNIRTKQLQASNRELEAFAYSVSHDLRAPLRHIVGFSEKLDRTLNAAEISPEVERLSSKIKDSALKLGELIDELLTFSRLGRTDVNKNSTSITMLVKEVIDEFLIFYSKNKVEWNIQKLPEVKADSVLLKIVFQNLINNSLKFSEKKVKTLIDIGYTENKYEYVFFVRDNGAGFNMEYADKLFGVFQRLHSSDDFPGTGIGLATVRRIVNKHGGRIWAEGKENVGATFFFSIPK